MMDQSHASLALRSDKAARFSDRVLRAFEAGPKDQFRVMAAQDGSPELRLYDEIGAYGITAKDFIAALDETKGPLTLRINSPGGDVFDGLAMYNAVKRRGNVNVVVDGVAASAASIVAMAGKPISMSEGAMLMIHRAWGVCIGNTADMSSTAAVLAKVDDQLAGIYAGRSGRSRTACLGIMDAETWLTAEEAKASGFADVALGGQDGSTSRNSANARRLRLAEADDHPPANESGARAADARRLRLRIAEAS